MLNFLRVFLVLTVYSASVGACAATGIVGGSPDSCGVPAQSNPPAHEASGSRHRGLRELPRSIFRDQKFLWLRPFRLKRHDVAWTAAFLGTTAGLIAIDRRVAQELSSGPPGTGFAFSHRVGQAGGRLTDFGIAGAFYLVGHWRDDDGARDTGLLGLQALADAAIVVEILKSVSQRPRPTVKGGRLRNHHADGEFFTGGRAFPSGHAAGSWAFATVVAHQYRHHRWLPPTAYGLAGLVAVARVTGRKHFPADIFVGSVLGYLVGRHVYHSAQRMPKAASRRWMLLPSFPPTGGAAIKLVWVF